MGAPGYALFCSKGHLVYWWEEHLYWTDEMSAELKSQREGSCICGDKDIIEISHYGGINDCICLDKEQEEKGIRLTHEVDEFIIPFEHACDKKGNPLTNVFTKVRYPVYYIPDNVRDGSVWQRD